MTRSPMNRTHLLLMFVLLWPMTAVAASHSAAVMPESAVWLVGDSTLHPFTSRSSQVQVVGAVNAEGGAVDAILKSGALKSFDVVIPVQSLKSKESALDKNMYKALKADTCPTISFHLSDYAVSKDSVSAEEVHAQANGTLTIACQERPVTLETTLTPGADSLHVQGNYPLLMTDYGVKPPTMMMGTIKVKNPVLIHFDLQLSLR
jgi:polyisoprenoid-binding protein YceI